MSDQEKRKRLLKIVGYFLDSEKTVSDLKMLLRSPSENSDKNAPTDDEDTRKQGWIGNVDSLVVLTSDALPDTERLIDDYCLYKGTETKTRTIITTYQKIKPSNNNQYEEVRKEWRNEFNVKIQLGTKLTTILNYIKIFAASQPKPASEKDRKKVSDFQKFLTDIQSGVSAEALLETKATEIISDKTLEIISGAIKSSTKKCVIFTGAPGTGKTHCVEQYVKKISGQKGEEDHPNWIFVQFHSSYDYTDFVEGLRPIQENGKDGKIMVFVRMDGIFKSFCRRAANKKDEKFYFIIDEINRADLGRVFGELMYCFEKRGEKHKIATQYANLPAYGKDRKPIAENEDVFKDYFYIPENVVIIGTMNDIDRSVETFDFALRRRFDWVKIEADEVMKSSLYSMREDLLESMGEDLRESVKIPDDTSIDNLVTKIKKMNEVIKDGLNEEFKIGPAYFQDFMKGKDLETIWTHNIEPILQEYMRGRQNAGKFVKECGVALEVLPSLQGEQG